VTRPYLQVLAAGLLTLCLAPAAAAQDDDAALKPAEPDFALAALPTGLRLPKYKGAFRFTHRFLRPLNEGDFGDLAGDLFGLDNGAQIGLEYRFGVITGGQLGVHRTSDKTVEFFAQYSVLRQADGLFDVTAMAAIDGTNNFQDSYSPMLGAIVSYKVQDRLALYVEPMWVNNTNPEPSELVDNNDTFAVGIGGRWRFLETVYFVAEVTPRASGYRPGTSQASFGIEKRAGGHMFQVNFSNGFGTEYSQIARGATNGEDWYLGFNITRKFF